MSTARAAAAGAGADQAPPFRLPGQHFAAALLFLVAGAAGLAWRAPALAAGAFPDRGLVAAAHLLTLGWISTSVMGALYQFLPVALGAPVRWRGLADATFVLWTAGVAAFALGVASGRPTVSLIGAGALGLAVALFAANLTDTLRRAPDRGLAWWCVAGAVTSLAGAWVLGALLAVNLSQGVLGGSRFTVLVVHLHVAAGGWVLLTMIGVADRLLPMFLLSHGAGDRAGKTAAALVAAGTAGLLLSGHLLPVEVLSGALALQAAGAAAFLVQARRHYAARRRTRIDPGMRLVAGALVLLGAAVVVGTAALLSGAPGGRLLTVYGVLLVPGGLGLFVAGHQYRILPFLTWFHRFGPVAGERDVPDVADLFDHRVADTAGALLWGGVALLALGVATAEEGLCRVGALAFGAGAVVQSAQMLRISRRRPA